MQTTLLLEISDGRRRKSDLDFDNTSSCTCFL